jgi:hypothetical protein
VIIPSKKLPVPRHRKMLVSGANADYITIPEQFPAISEEN